MEKKQTKAIRIQSKRTIHSEHSVPLFLTSSFVFDSAEDAIMKFNEEIPGNVYGRFGNPNSDEFIDKLCMLEEAQDGVSFSTGMAAVFGSIAALLNSGDHIIACRSVFGSTFMLLSKILPKWNISCTLADASEQYEWDKYILPNTKMIFIETPSNPALEIIDLENIRRLKEKYNLIVNVDNCFATPILQLPIKWGADLVTHSATKYIDGQGRVMGGAVLGSSELIREIRGFARTTGPTLSPFNAWVLSKSLETLSLRMERHCSNAQKLAVTLENSELVNFVRYPFLDSHPQSKTARAQMLAGGAIVTFEVKGGFESAKKFINNIKLLSITSNLGDSRTTITHPPSTTHSKLSTEDKLRTGITPGLIRVSVGLEDIVDIENDILQALRIS